MSKYILEIKPEYEANGIMILGARDSHLYVTTLEVKDLEELNSDYINEHFGSLQDDAYKRGLEDGKAVHEKGCEGCEHECKNKMTQPCILCCNAYKNRWIAKSDKIEVGDEVITPDGTHFVVFEVGGYFGDDAVGTFILFGENNSSVDIKAGCFSHSMTLIAKTGRHFDINKILAEMRT